MNNKEGKKKMLLQVASEVLLELSPHKTTLGDIANRAGMANTSLYYHFRDKKEIFTAVISDESDEQVRFIERMAKMTNDQDTAEAKMNSLVESHYHFIFHRAQRVSKKTSLEYLSLYGMFEPIEDYYLQTIKDIIEHILREGIKKGAQAH